MHKLAKTILLTCLICSLQANAKTTNEIITSGVGTISCGEWFELSKQDRVGASYYLQGFFTALNIEKSTKNGLGVQTPDGGTLLLYVDKACREDPSYSISLIAYGVYYKLLRE